MCLRPYLLSEQNLLVEEADMKGLEELCNVLALPEVKMIRRADDDMRQHEKKEKTSKKRKAKENSHSAANDDFDEDMPLAKKHVKTEKAEGDDGGYFDVKNVKVEPTLGEIDEREDQVCSPHQIIYLNNLELTLELWKPKSLNHTSAIIERHNSPLVVVVLCPSAYNPLR